MPPRALWLNSTSRATACFSATLHASKWYLAAALEHQPYVSARAIYELGLSPLSLSTIATLSGSHVIAGAAAAHEQPGECSGDSHDGGWRWGAPLGRLAWYRLDPCTGSGPVKLFGSVPLSTLNAQPPELKHAVS
jgi:hypothetical protein